MKENRSCRCEVTVHDPLRIVCGETRDIVPCNKIFDVFYYISLCKAYERLLNSLKNKFCMRKWMQTQNQGRNLWRSGTVERRFWALRWSTGFIPMESSHLIDLEELFYVK